MGDLKLLAMVWHKKWICFSKDSFFFDLFLQNERVGLDATGLLNWLLESIDKVTGGEDY